MTNETTEMWKDFNEAKQDAKAQRRAHALTELTRHGITYTVHNNGAHLIVEGHAGYYIDFWPGTGKWKEREGKEGFTISKLIEYIKGDNYCGPNRTS